MPALAEGPRTLVDLFGLGGDEPSRVEVAQNQEVQLLVRVQELEEQVRALTGQIEGLTFQLTQIQTMLANQQAGATTPTAPPVEQPATTTNDQSSIDLTIPEGGVQPLPGELEFDPNFDDLATSQDPLLGTGQGDQPATLGTLDLTLDGVAAPNADASAQFQAAYDALLRGDYSFAEEQFAQFLALYPEDPQVADATNWYGEALLKREAYGEATEVLFAGFQKFPESPRAPEILLRLGIALVGSQELDTACRTFAEIPRRYSGLSEAFSQRLSEEQARAQCPPVG